MARSTAGAGSGDVGRGPVAPPDAVASTGRYVVVLSDAVHGDEAAMSDALRATAGITNIASTSAFHAGALDIRQAQAAEATMFTKLGISVVAADPDRAASLTAAAAQDERIKAVEPEQTLYAIAQPTVVPLEYLRGYADAATDVYQHANSGDGGRAATQVAAAAQFVDTPALTWGLQATRVSTSDQSGQGVPVAVLDTGFDLSHPDFVGRPITGTSFVSGETEQDVHGHGTHVTGTSSGPAHPPGGHRRYGVAYGDNIFVGKVLNNQGIGFDTNILAGINWAITNGCRIISMSLGANIPTISPVYETAGQRALDAGTLIIAAAGNNADRTHGNFGFVGVPANSPSIIAVGALDSQLELANFSPRSNSYPGGEIDIAAPGVDVDSSWLMPQRYRAISGTSMATPHVSGIAAQWSAATDAAGLALWGLLLINAEPLPIPSVDVGAGLVQAPQ